MRTVFRIPIKKFQRKGSLKLKTVRKSPSYGMCHLDIRASGLMHYQVAGLPPSWFQKSSNWWLGGGGYLAKVVRMLPAPSVRPWSSGAVPRIAAPRGVLHNR